MAGMGLPIEYLFESHVPAMGEEGVLLPPIRIEFPDDGVYAPLVETEADKAADELWDLRAAIENNSCPFPPTEIRAVEVVARGSNEDGADWVWRINNDAWVAIGGCDYTGWDCQSWLTWYAPHKQQAAEPAANPDDYTMSALSAAAARRASY